MAAGKGGVSVGEAMSKVPLNSAYIGLLAAGQRQFIIGHLFTFTTADGTQNDYFTDLEEDVVYGGQRYKSGGLRIQGMRTKLAVGVNVDEQEVIIWASPTDTLFGAAFLTGMAEGIMDGGMIAKDRIIWLPQTGDVSQDMLAQPVAVWRAFSGYMSTIERLGRASVTFKVKSPLVKLGIDLPRNFYQPGCLWSLFDSGCTLNRAAFAFNGTFTGTPTATQLQVAGNVSPFAGGGPDALPYYQRGRLVFTSGINDGLEVTIDTNDVSTFYLAYALNAIPSAGDSFTAYPGCSKTFGTCQLKFNNTANFRGFDRVPPVFVAV
jgi:uncharacterized phage protein (TIGR02218 family)